MKKSVLFSLAVLAAGAFSANAQEVTYVEDCSQGYLINKNASNWFMTAEGGTNVLFGADESKAEFKNRLGGNAALYFGKWVTPTFGFRFGGQYLMTKGATTLNGAYRKLNSHAFDNGYYPEKMQAFGPEFDVLINLTNWWCGYRPGRVYNGVLHGGAGMLYTMYRGYKNNEVKWRDRNNSVIFLNVGLQNNFAVSKYVDLFIDVQYEIGRFQPTKRFKGDLSLSAGLNVYFGSRDWNCPTTAVCPTWKYTDAEGDALVARLSQADAKINNLQRQLDECLKRPAKAAAADCGLATVYYPINQSTLSKREKTILKSMAAVMNENPNQKYVLTGWADNYTGNDEINTRLRNARVNGVKKYLMSCGVAESQLDARIDANNLTDFGVKGAPMDRAVTIKLAD